MEENCKEKRKEAKLKASVKLELENGEVSGLAIVISEPEDEYEQRNLRLFLSELKRTGDFTLISPGLCLKLGNWQGDISISEVTIE